MEDFEKLGVFYLGRNYDMVTKKAKDELILYDSRDLVTHAVCVGMTGSGKTGLCINLIEEAAIDAIPAILIDPKGDLTNLLLTFPQLDAASFLPWINPDEARRKGLSEQEFADQQAKLWSKGLRDWGESGERIQKLKDSAEFVIYTPGSNSGIPVSILKSFAVPPGEILNDGEMLQERINTLVTSLLGLLNIQADPLQSREHILMSTIIGKLWSQGKDLDLTELIAKIQDPPITKVGVLDLETFYPAKERFTLVLALNNMLASPSFNAWIEGVPLDIDQILHTAQGKPRIAIFSIAHLADNERMFFMAMLLNQVLGWMRTQPGTTSLRALVYIDEIFGFFPPVANPPSKLPLLTLLKQARAFGVGIVLATQNPVDLDYKGLANTGTWFIGRLQTDRDKQRVMDGLEGAAIASGSQFDPKKMEQLLSGLDSRVFLMNNVHEDAPVIFQTRWCLSYLRGPLTRGQIKQLMDPVKSALLLPAQISAEHRQPGSVASTDPAVLSATERPALDTAVTQYFIPIRGKGDGILYQPMLLGAAKIHFTDTKSLLDETRTILAMTPILDQAIPVEWDAAIQAEFATNDLETQPVPGAQFSKLPGEAEKAKNYTEWSKDFSTWLYGSQTLELLRSPSAGERSRPGESERDFRVRLQQVTREHRDQAVEELRQKYMKKVNALQEKIRKAEQAVDREAAQAKQAKVQAAVNAGATLLGAFTGRRLVSSTNISRASSTMRGVSRSMQQQEDVARAKESVKAYQQQLEELSAQFEADSEALASKIDPSTEALESVIYKPRKADIAVQLVTLVWAPYQLDAQKRLTPGW
ncbi:MAG: hypothetical protein JXB85_06840 [Anaerolineales bacterium]|nr:hypothetical protein [Anaerolineales bacterium]